MKGLNSLNTNNNGKGGFPLNLNPFPPELLAFVLDALGRDWGHWDALVRDGEDGIERIKEKDLPRAPICHPTHYLHQAHLELPSSQHKG